ncbi:Uncharacterized protein DBV15_12947 [Temnothorax longispinosus]|uniref:Uncharacterized protein n=1 Tax=Temnothorax longispinosus TaxID=300112 RepID=A0A4S2L1K2_9HYME|nr:Uncharacterized protein DBV15_12947 [Temnothorax longispinosus]
MDNKLIAKCFFSVRYGSSWYTFSVKSKKLLRVLLYRSLAPCTLTAGKMFVMSMTMCSSVRLSLIYIPRKNIFHRLLKY